MLYINTHDWSKQSKSTRSSLIVPSESNDDLLEGQIFIHVTILLYLLIAKQGTCILLFGDHIFSPVFLNPPGRTLTFQHVTRISLVQTIACTLRHGLTLLTKIVFQIFVHAGPKRLQQLSDDYSVVLPRRGHSSYRSRWSRDHPLTCSKIIFWQKISCFMCSEQYSVMN